MEWNEHPLEPHHQGVPSVGSKMISDPMICLAQTMHLSCTSTNTVSKWTETVFHLTHVTNEFNQVHPKRFLSLWYVWRKLCTYLPLTLTLSPNGPKKNPNDPRHLWVPLVVSITISEPMVCSVQILHLSCVKISTIPKWTESSFHLSLVT
jgi:hypothetical protein